MGFRLRRTKDEQRSLPPAENQVWPIWAQIGSTITPTAALAIADVWAAVRVLADAASSLPLHVYRKTGDGREQVTSGKLVDLLEQPSPGTSQADLVSSVMSHLAIWGNAYVAKYRQGPDVVQLGLLHPERVRPKLAGGQLTFSYSPGSGPERVLTGADVVQVRGLSVDGVNGLSAVQQASRVIGLSDNLVRHALSYFDDGSNSMGGIPRPAGVLKLSEDATSTQRQGAKEVIRNEARPHGILVVTGDVDYTAISTPLDQAQFVEQRRLVAQEVARVFRIPPHMLGAPTADSMTYSNVEQESIEFVRYSLTPWLRRIELALSNDPDLAFAKQYVRFETDALLRSDAKTRAEVYALALDPVSGWMDVDEVRRLEDLPPRGAPTSAQVMARAIQQMTTPTGAPTNGNG